MKKLLVIAAAGIITLIGSAYTLQTIINWKIDNEKAMVKFTMQAHGKEMIGNFKGAAGEVKFDETTPANSSITCSVDVSSINTGIEARDKHLQGPEFFDAAANPQIKFVSTKIEKTKEGYLVTGNLTAKAITKEVSAPFTFVKSNDGGSFKGSFGIKRLDFNIGKEGADPANDIMINFDIPVTEIK
ncbi:MAG: YceI family protein [Ferruginibacter sp.]